jgi:hypothetical protein
MLIFFTLTFGILEWTETLLSCCEIFHKHYVCRHSTLPLQNHSPWKVIPLSPRYSWNTAKVGIKHQSINQSSNSSNSDYHRNINQSKFSTEIWIWNFFVFFNINSNIVKRVLRHVIVFLNWSYECEKWNIKIAYYIYMYMYSPIIIRGTIVVVIVW